MDSMQESSSSSSSSAPPSLSSSPSLLSSSGMEHSHPDWKIIRHPLYHQRSSPWFDLRVFYIRFMNIKVNDSAPETLTLSHIPLSPNTIIEVNGRRSSIYSDSVSSSLRRDRVERETAELTFVGTGSIRLNGSAMFEVCNKEELLLSVTLELSDGDGVKTWNISCRPASSSGCEFLKVAAAVAEVYVTGKFSGSPIILTKSFQLGFVKKNQRKKVTLDVIPEYEEPRSEFKSFLEHGAEEEYESLYRRPEYFDREDGELSWFNAGVRVGVGIGLGICVGVGLGVGLLARTYMTATKTFKRRIV